MYDGNQVIGLKLFSCRLYFEFVFYQDHLGTIKVYFYQYFIATI